MNFRVADQQCPATIVTALRESDFDRFYKRHGFQYRNDSEGNIHYIRLPGTIEIL